ncbi:MAG: 6-bladed beta-propeller [Rubrivivax sp.]|nr:6-bladed beta-propeller [Rubrivivax sp.]
MHTIDPGRRVLLASLAAALAAGCGQMPQPADDKVFKPPVFPPPPEQPRFVWERVIRSSGDVIADETGDLRRLITGEDQRGEALSKPYAVAVFRGRIYVSDTVTRYVRLFDVPAGKSYRIGDDDGAGQLTKPIGLDIDAAGQLYVADIGAKAVMVYGPDRGFVRKIGGDKWFQRLTSVTVDPAGTRIYAVDLGGVGSEQHMVRVFDARTGAHLQDIGKRGTGPGEFNLPRDLAIGADGRLYVVDGGNFRVVVFDRDGKYLQSFGSVGKQFGQFARPKEIAADREGNVYVIDAAFGNFQIFNPDGELLLFVGDRSERDAPAKYMLPSGIAVDEDGRVYVVDQWFRKIDVYRPATVPAGSGFLARKPATAPALPASGKSAS